LSLLREVGNHKANAADIVTNAWACTLEYQRSSIGSAVFDANILDLADVQQFAFDSATRYLICGYNLNNIISIGK
jgi:hypothetical protein